MPDDFDAPAVSGEEQAALSNEFEQFYSDVGAAALNPWIPEISDLGPRRRAQEIAKIQAALEAAESRGTGAVIELVKLHIGRYGNWKLPSTYLTFNMTCAHECPSLRFRGDGTIDVKQTTCQAFTPEGDLDCYAIRDEQTGCKDKVWPFRIRQQELWRTLLKKHPEYMVEAVHALAAMARGGKTALRFQVAGDFPDQASVDTFAWIARVLGETVPTPRKWGLPFVTYTYTARRSLKFTAVNRVPRVQGERVCVVMGSNFKKKGIAGVFRYVVPPDGLEKEDAELVREAMVDAGEVPAESGSGPRYGRYPKKQWSLCHGEFKNVSDTKYGCRGCRRCFYGLNSVVIRHGQSVLLNKAMYYPRSTV